MIATHCISALGLTMSSTIEQRVDDDLVPTREKDICSKRDDAPTSDGDYDTNGNMKVTSGSERFRGKQQQHEIQYQNDAFRQSKALLEQVLNEYDVQHQEEKTVLQEKIVELEDETEWYKNHFFDEISLLNDKVDSKFYDIKALMDDFIGNEQEERNAAFQEIEEQLNLRDKEVDGLLKVIAKQSDELKQAKLERDKLKKEMKSILVTLHVQFERFEDKIFKSEAEVTLLREDQKADTQMLFGDIEKIKEGMVMFQEHINDAKIGADVHVQNTNETIALAHRENQDQLQNMIYTHSSIISDCLQQQKSKLENMSLDVKIALAEQKRNSIFQDEVHRRFVETEERCKSIESSVSKNQTLLEDVQDFVFNKTAAAMEDLHAKKVEILNRIDSLTDQAFNIEKEVSELSDNMKTLEKEKESDDIKWKEAYELIEERVQTANAGICCHTDINSVKQNLKSVVELLSSKLADLWIEVNSNVIAQKSVNNELKNQHSSYDEKLDTVGKMQ